MIFFVHKKTGKHSSGPFLIPFVQVSPNIDFPKKFDSNSFWESHGIVQKSQKNLMRGL